jgi:hypothetical protein
MSHQMLECITEWAERVKEQAKGKMSASDSANGESYEFVPKT